MATKYGIEFRIKTTPVAEWKPYKRYLTEKARDIALRDLLTANGGTFEYRASKK